jgi:hypothetical protein
MMSALKSIIPGAESLAAFERNKVEQFEARFVMVEIPNRRRCSSPAWPAAACRSSSRTARARRLRQRRARPSVLVGHALRRQQGRADRGLSVQPERFAGRPDGVTTADGRFTIMMPHPERVFRTVQMSWHPENWARIRRGCACSATRGAGCNRMWKGRDSRPFFRQAVQASDRLIPLWHSIVRCMARKASLSEPIRGGFSSLIFPLPTLSTKASWLQQIR